MNRGFVGIFDPDTAHVALKSELGDNPGLGNYAKQRARSKGERCLERALGQARSQTEWSSMAGIGIRFKLSTKIKWSKLRTEQTLQKWLPTPTSTMA